MRTELRDENNTAWSRLQLASIAIEQQRAGDAERLARDAVSAFERLKGVESGAVANAWLSAALLEQGKTGDAATAAERAVALARSSASRGPRFEATIARARVLGATGKVPDAVTQLEATIAEANKYGYLPYELQARLVLGRIEVGPRHRGEYSEAERALLRTVAGQAAASVANVRLTARLAQQLAELTASRERLVAAQDDERRRLERDLHDGIQQDIVAQIAGLRLARNRLERGQLSSAELAELQEQARQTLTDLRELAHGIHPPVLSDNGLVAAIESGAARYPIPLEVHADARVRAER